MQTACDTPERSVERSIARMRGGLYSGHRMDLVSFLHDGGPTILDRRAGPLSCVWLWLFLLLFLERLQPFSLVLGQVARDEISNDLLF